MHTHSGESLRAHTHTDNTLARASSLKPARRTQAAALWPADGGEPMDATVEHTQSGGRAAMFLTLEYTAAVVT